VQKAPSIDKYSTSGMETKGLQIDDDRKHTSAFCSPLMYVCKELHNLLFYYRPQHLLGKLPSHDSFRPVFTAMLTGLDNLQISFKE